MKIFAIIDEETTLLTGILLYYEKEGTCVIELPEYIDLPAWLLYDEESNIPLNLNDFKVFKKNNVLDTTESCDLLECSRQNMSYMVRKQQLTPVKEEVRGNLYLKGDVLRTLW